MKSTTGSTCKLCSQCWPLFKRTSKYLEADEYPIGSKVLKKLWRLYKSLQQLHHDEPNAATRLAVKPLCGDLLTKFDDLVKDPTLMWQWAFLAFMDPSGGSVCNVPLRVRVRVCVDHSCPNRI